MNTSIKINLVTTPGVAKKHLPLSLRKSVMLSCACVVLGFSETSRGQSLSLIEGFEAIPNTGWIPCDPVIAAGPASLVTMVNSKMVIFNKQGAKLFEQNLNGASGFWGEQGGSAVVAEPWVIFDPNSGRFIASAAHHGTAKGVICFAVSKNSAPSSSSDWYKYRLDRSGTHQGPNFSGVPTYPDYAKVGVDGDAIYITSIHFAKDQNITGNFSHSEIFGIEKTALLAGGPINLVHNEAIIPKSAASTIFPAIVFELPQFRALRSFPDRGCRLRLRC